MAAGWTAGIAFSAVAGGDGLGRPSSKFCVPLSPHTPKNNRAPGGCLREPGARLAAGSFSYPSRTDGRRVVTHRNAAEIAAMVTEVGKVCRSFPAQMWCCLVAIKWLGEYFASHVTHTTW